jgi:SAM-dependent methyltransferase
MELAPRTSASAGYWDQVASEKRFTLPLRLDWLSKYLGPQACVLDFGCGYGRTLDELQRAGYGHSTGLDISLGMLREYPARFRSARVAQCDGRGIPCRTASADLVLLIAVLTCIPADTDQRALVHEVQRVLRPGGLMYIGDFLLNDDARNRQRYQDFARRGAPYGVFQHPEGVVLRHHRPEWIEELTGHFQRLEYQTFEAVTMNGNRSAGFQYLGRTVNSY